MEQPVRDEERPAVDRPATVEIGRPSAGLLDEDHRRGRVPGREVDLDHGFGDFWGYALLAEGAAEAMVEVDLSPWDAAAPTVLIEEAGGRVTDLDGRRAIDSKTFLATNGLLHEEFLERLGQRGSGD